MSKLHWRPISLLGINLIDLKETIQYSTLYYIYHSFIFNIFILWFACFFQFFIHAHDSKRHTEQISIPQPRTYRYTWAHKRKLCVAKGFQSLNFSTKLSDWMLLKHSLPRLTVLPFDFERLLNQFVATRLMIHIERSSVRKGRGCWKVGKFFWVRK